MGNQYRVGKRGIVISVTIAQNPLITGPKLMDILYYFRIE